ncbi:MAG: ExeM/NucH family extracellular endonuclease [Actinomycetota bacterium]|nr:ExeM/NucH family extracellular endonuclease [Actinomycetota bacterium]
MPRALPAALAVIATLLAFAPGAAAQAPEVRINEFHYDNVGTDEGERIELSGPAGADLNGWQVVLYNGSGGAVYDTRTLSGPIPGSGFLVLEYPVNGIQNGAPDGIVLADSAGNVVDALSYEGSFTAVGGPADGRVLEDIGVEEGSSTPVGHSLQLVDGTWTGPLEGTFGAANTPGGGEEPPPQTPPVCDADGATPISDIQGSGFSSPLQGDQVETEGVVVGDFQGSDGLNGVFIQDPVGDGNSATSEGLFVFDPDGPALDEGDVVRVRGTVDEFFGLTQVDEVDGLTICDEDVALPAPTALDLPTEGPLDRERLEGMLIVGDDPLAATETRLTDNFGEIRLAEGGPLVNPTEVVDPGPGARELADDNAARSIILDDASNERDPMPVPFIAPQDTVRRGDTVSDLTGVLSFGFGSYRVQPTEPVDFAVVNPRPPAPAPVGGDVRAASYNVLNYFTTLGERGADTPEELERQEAKIVAGIEGLDAAVVALQEIENDDGRSTRNLVDALNEAAGEQRWAAVPEPANSTEGDAIANAIIYRPGEVRRVGESVALVDPAFDNAREPVAQIFQSRRERFAVISNHFKSKGCGGATGANADQGDGAGCFDADRTEQARALVGFVDELESGRGGRTGVLVLGDLNSYAMEAPIDVLREAGLVDLLAQVPETDRYSFVFDGAEGRLDHAFANRSFAEAVTGATIWHTNADEPDAFQYTGPEEFYAPDAFRGSDHDPALVGIQNRGRPGGR